MITKEEIPSLLGHTAYDSSHKKIGTVEHIYLDSDTGQPEWLTIRTGLFGTKETFVPVGPAEIQGDEVIVPFGKDEIKNAPNVDLEVVEELPEDQEARIYDYYGLGTPAGEAMIRSEEELRAERQAREPRRTRLRRYTTGE
jgi:sporulation protein YlmC with PRC-barrel domain